MSISGGFPYISRDADKILLDLLTEKRYCYVQSPPGTGKTLLLNELKNQLTQNNIKCAVVSVKQLEEETDSSLEEDWHLELVEQVEKQFDEFNLVHSDAYLSAGWRRYRREHFRQALGVSIREVLRPQLSGEVVIIFDDVDILLNQKFQAQKTEDDQESARQSFFATLCQCYRDRNEYQAEEPNFYAQLTFVLAGSVLGHNLDGGGNYNLFDSISETIKLEDFSRSKLEAAPEVDIWLRGINSSYGGLEEVRKRTQGHPALTAYLAPHVQDFIVNWDSFISNEFVLKWQANEPDEPGFLKKIRERLELPENQNILELYKQILDGAIINSNPSNPEHKRLVSSGIVAVRDDYFKVHNPIFAEISRSWTCITRSALQNNEETVNLNSTADTTSTSPTSTPDESLSSETSTLGVNNPPVLGQKGVTVLQPQSSTRISYQTWLGFAVAILSAVALVIAFWLADGVYGSGLLLLFGISLGLALLSFEKENPGGSKNVWNFIQRSFPSWIATLVSRVSNSIDPLIQWLRSALHDYKGHLVALAIITSLVIVFWKNIETILLPDQRGIGIKNEAIAALTTFWDDSGESQELKAMQVAVEAAADLQELQTTQENLHKFRQQIPWIKDLPKYQPPTIPLLALQQIHFNIHEQNQFSLEGYENLSDVTVSRNGKIAITAIHVQGNAAEKFSDGVLLWTKKGDRTPVSWSTTQNEVHDLMFSPDGDYLVTTGGNGTVNLWHVEPPERSAISESVQELPLEQLPGNTVQKLNIIAFQDNYIAVTDAKGKLSLWLRKGTRFELFHPNQEDPSTLNDSLDESDLDSQKCLMALGVDETTNSTILKTWRINEHLIVPQINKKLNNSKILRDLGMYSLKTEEDANVYLPKNISLSTDEKLMAIGEEKNDRTGGRIQLWEIGSEMGNRCVPVKVIKLFYTDAPITTISLGNKEWLVASGQQGFFQVWKLSSGQVEIKGRGYSSSRKGSIFPLGENQFITAVGDKKARVWDLQTKGEKAESKLKHNPKITASIGTRIESSKLNARSLIVMAGGKVITFDNALNPQGELYPPNNAADETITNIAVSDDGSNLATGDAQGSIRFWDWATATQQEAMPVINTGLDTISSLTFSPTLLKKSETERSTEEPTNTELKDKSEDDYVAVAGSRSILFYSLTEAASPGIIPNVLPGIRSIHLSPDRNYLAALLQDNTVKLYDVSDIAHPNKPMSLDTTRVTRLVDRVWSSFSSKSSLLKLDQPVLDIQFYPKLVNQDNLLVTLPKNGKRLDFWQLHRKVEDKQAEDKLNAKLVGFLDANELAKADFYPDKQAPIWKQLQFRKDEAKERSYLAISGEGEIQIWDLSGVTWENESMTEHLMAVFRDSSWGSITNLTFGLYGHIIASAEKSQLFKLSIGDLAVYLKWGCDWLDDYHHTHPGDTSAKACPLPISHPTNS